MPPEPWPFPADTVLDRARSIARSYRHALRTADPDLCTALDNAACKYGETWLLEKPITKPEDELHSAEEVAEIVGVKPNTVRVWAKRQHINRYVTSSGGRYNLHEVREYLAQRRRARLARNKPPKTSNAHSDP